MEFRIIKQTMKKRGQHLGQGLFTAFIVILRNIRSEVIQQVVYFFFLLFIGIYEEEVRKKQQSSWNIFFFIFCFIC